MVKTIETKSPKKYEQQFTINNSTIDNSQLARPRDLPPPTHLGKLTALTNE